MQDRTKVLENLFWSCNTQSDCDIYAVMSRSKVVSEESEKVQDAIYEYIANRMGYGKYNVDIELLETAGYLETDIQVNSPKTKNKKKTRPMKEIAAEHLAKGYTEYWSFARGWHIGDIEGWLNENRQAYITPTGCVMIQSQTDDKFIKIGEPR